MIVNARLDVTEDRRVLIAQNIDSAIALRDKSATEAMIAIDMSSVSSRQLERLKSVLGEFKGECAVKLLMRQPNHSEVVLALPPVVRVAPSEALCNRVEELFGVPVVTFR